MLKCRAHTLRNQDFWKNCNLLKIFSSVHLIIWSPHACRMPAIKPARVKLKQKLIMHNRCCWRSSYLRDDKFKIRADPCLLVQHGLKSKQMASETPGTESICLWYNRQGEIHLLGPKILRNFGFDKMQYHKGPLRWSD